MPEEPPRDEAEAFALLRAHGGRITPSRRDLIRHFFTHDAGVTVDELLALYPAFDPATLYRTVNVLEEAGVVEHIHLGHGAATYKRTGAATISIVCERCGGTLDVARSEFEPLAASVRAAHGFQIDLHHFAITGTCAHCSATQARPGAGRSRAAAR